MATSPDRLARSTTYLLGTVGDLKARVDNRALNTDPLNGQFVLTVSAAVAELERAVADPG